MSDWNKALDGGREELRRAEEAGRRKADAELYGRLRDDFDPASRAAREAAQTTVERPGADGSYLVPTGTQVGAELTLQRHRADGAWECFAATWSGETLIERTLLLDENGRPRWNEDALMWEEVRHIARVE